MAYYLRQTKKAKGIYLQVYKSSWNKELKQPRSRSVEAIGYVDELVSDEIPDPVSYYKEYVDRLNAERAALSADETRPRAFVSPIELYAGHFLLHSLMEELGVKEIIGILASARNFQFSILDTN